MTNNNQLKQLVEVIVRETLKELMGSTDLSYLDSTNSTNKDVLGINNDPFRPPVDAMTSIEKSKFDRDKEKERRIALKSTEQELKTAKKEKEFQQQKVDQARRFKIPTLNKKIQQLKGSSRSTSGTL